MKYFQVDGYSYFEAFEIFLPRPFNNIRVYTYWIVVLLCKECVVESIHTTDNIVNMNASHKFLQMLKMAGQSIASISNP